MSTVYQLATYCSQRLEGLWAEEVVREDRRALVSVWMVFGRSRGVGLRCSSDGWGVSVFRDAPVAADMGESGAIEVVDASRRWDIANQRLASIDVVRSSDTPEPYGVRLKAEEGGSLWIYNWGDELAMSAEKPRHDPLMTLSPLCS